MQKACHRQLLLHPLPLKTKWLIHENDLKPVLDPAESCHQNLCTDTVITLTVKAASILYTRSINAKSLCIDRPCLISCTAHGIFLCLYYLVHSDDQKYILRAECISCNTVCISININKYTIFTHRIHTSKKPVRCKCL